MFFEKVKPGSSPDDLSLLYPASVSVQCTQNVCRTAANRKQEKLQQSPAIFNIISRNDLEKPSKDAIINQTVFCVPLEIASVTKMRTVRLS